MTTANSPMSVLLLFSFYVHNTLLHQAAQSMRDNCRKQVSMMCPPSDRQAALPFINRPESEECVGVSRLQVWVDCKKIPILYVFIAGCKYSTISAMLGSPNTHRLGHEWSSHSTVRLFETHWLYMDCIATCTHRQTHIHCREWLSCFQHLSPYSPESHCFGHLLHHLELCLCKFYF